MHHYQTVIVAVDFSQHSEVALARGHQLAQYYHATLQVVHVVEIPTYPVLEDVAVTGLPGVWQTELTEQLMENAHRKMQRLLGQYQLNAEQGVIVNGIPSDEIVNRAQQVQAGLIVMGRHGAKGWKRLLGSTTDRVLSHANCDVLAVRLDKEIPA